MLSMIQYNTRRVKRSARCGANRARCEMIQWAGPCLYVDGPAYDRAKDASEQRTFLPRDGFVECVAKH